MAHYSSKPCDTEDCCCGGKIDSEDCSISWETNNATFAQLKKDGGLFATGLSGTVTNPDSGLYELEVQCKTSGIFVVVDLLDWTKDTVNCCDQDTPSSPTCRQLLEDANIETWALTLETDSPLFTQPALDILNATFVLTEWFTPGLWVNFGGSLPTGSVNWPSSSGCFGNARYGIILNSNLSFKCKMNLKVLIYESSSFLSAGAGTGNTIDCATYSIGSGAFSLSGFGCSGEGSRFFSYELSGLT